MIFFHLLFFICFVKEGTRFGPLEVREGERGNADADKDQPFEHVRLGLALGLRSVEDREVSLDFGGEGAGVSFSSAGVGVVDDGGGVFEVDGASFEGRY